MNRVPHCSECNRCISTKYVYTSFYCCEENEKSKIYASLGVGHPPKTSPKYYIHLITVESMRMQLLKNTGKMNMSNTYQMHSQNQRRSLLKKRKKLIQR